MATTLYEPPQPVEKCRTQGKFGNVHVLNASQRFVIEREWQHAANPHYVDLMRTRDQFDRRMLEKKHNQAILMAVIQQEQMNSQKQSPNRQ